MYGFPVLWFHSLPHQNKASSLSQSLWIVWPFVLANELIHASLLAEYKRQEKGHIY